MNIKVVSIFCLSFFVLFLWTVSTAQAQAEVPVCEVMQYSTSLNTLPLNGNRVRIQPSDPIVVGTNYLYTFNIRSAIGTTNHIRAIYMQMMGGANEPLDIVAIRFIGGPCTVDADKRITCDNLNYQYTSDTPEVMEVLVRPTEPLHGPNSSVLFTVFSDQGKSICSTMNRVVSSTVSTPTPRPQLPAVTNFHVVGYRSVIGTEYKEAIIEWNKISGAKEYTIVSGVENSETFAGVTDGNRYTLRFKPTSIWYLRVFAKDASYYEGLRTQWLQIEYPGADSLPAVSDSFATPTPRPQLPAVSNLRIKGYRSLIGSESNYKEAILTWSPLSGVANYEIWRMNADTPYSFGGSKEATYAVRFLPDTTWDVAVYAMDMSWIRGQLSETVHIVYPGVDSLPAVPSSNSTPMPTSTPRPLPTVTPRPFDSTKMALLEEKVSSLEQKLQAQEQTNLMQTQRIEKTESLLTKIRNLLTRWFRI